MGRAVLLGQLGLLGSTGRADDGGAQVAQQLAQQQAHAAGGGVDEDGLALFDRVGLLDQRQRRHAHEEAADGVFVRDAVGDLDHPVRGHGAVLGVAAPGHPHDAVAFLEAQAFGAVALDLGDDARRLLADHQGQAARRRV